MSTQRRQEEPTPESENAEVFLRNAPGNYYRKTSDYEIVKTCLLIGDVHMRTFNGSVERKRLGMLPDNLFRMGYDYSATMSTYVGNENHRKHKEKEHLKFDDNNAYQPFGTFFATQDLNRFRVQRHLSWNRVRDASSYVSAVNSLGEAETLAKDHYHDKSPPSDRVHVSMIATQGLIPATVHGKEQTTQNTYKSKKELIPMIPPTLTYRDVCIPVWIRSSAISKDGSKRITFKDWEESGADMWLSVKEQCERGSDMNARAANSHDSEWLSCGPILKKHIVKVLPFDGDTVHDDDGTCPEVKSKRSRCWIWSWDLRRWTSLLPPTKTTGQKRKLSDIQNEEDIEEDDDEDDQEDDDEDDQEDDDEDDQEDDDEDDQEDDDEDDQEDDDEDDQEDDDEDDQEDDDEDDQEDNEEAD